MERFIRVKIEKGPATVFGAGIHNAKAHKGTYDATTQTWLIDAREWAQPTNPYAMKSHLIVVQEQGL